MKPSRAAPTRRQFVSLASASVALPSLAGIGGTGRPRAKVRLAVVGGGFGARHHWHEHPDCEVTAVSDLVDARCQALARRYGCKATYPSLEKMLEQAHEQFDAVAIFTDAPSHARHAILCMEHGKHVVSACPVATSLADIALLKEKKESTGLIYMMHESSWYRQPCIAARELHAKGAFGRLAYSEVEYYHSGIGTRSNNLSRWQGKDSWRRGFPPMLYPTHSLGLLVGVTGERIVRVSCMGQLVGKDFPVGKDNVYGNSFDNEMALGYTDQGNICRFGVFWQIAAHGERGQWLGDKLSCSMQSSLGQPRARRKLRGRWEEWQVPDYWATERLPQRMRHDSGHGGSAAFLSAEFVEAVAAQREPTVDLYQSIAMNAPGIVAHQSAQGDGEMLKVPSFDK